MCCETTAGLELMRNYCGNGDQLLGTNVRSSDVCVTCMHNTLASFTDIFSFGHKCCLNVMFKNFRDLYERDN